jgi:hypothetical protein
MGISADEDAEVQEMYQAYHYCKLFNCSISEYESRPHKESQWMIQIDATYNDAIKELQERASST